VLLPNADTIAAIATAQGRGGVGVIRISGQKVDSIGCGILGKLPKPRHATFCNFIDNKGDILDQGIAIYFSGPQSYTGETVLELQGHGGPAVLKMLLLRCLELGARLANPGEFTLRAFLNNKLDLAQAESVADLIDANTTEAAKSAARTLRGDFSTAIQDLVERLIRLRMLVEAMLDFPDEQIDVISLEKRDELLDEIQSKLANILDTAKQGSLLREGAHVVIAGQPNVGKSSLLNRLSGEDAALVSDIPGTTRDVIRQTIQIHGVPLHIMDTAGIRESEDELEGMGMARTRETLQRADLILLLVDVRQGLTIQDELIIADLPKNIPHILVFNKIDMMMDKFDFAENINNSIGISAKTGEGMDSLRRMLLEAVGWRDQESGSFMARERHLRALALAQANLSQARAAIDRSELFAEELRLAQIALSEITGKFTADDLLGEIFSRFCIGK
jgi:tRNA modification GTPase